MDALYSMFIQLLRLLFVAAVGLGVGYAVVRFMRRKKSPK